MSEKEKRLEALSAILDVAWADGSFEEREIALAEQLVRAFALQLDELELPPDDQRRPLAELLVSEAERRYVYERAFMMSWVDGAFSPAEWSALEQLRESLHLSAAVVSEMEVSVLGAGDPPARS